MARTVLGLTILSFFFFHICFLRRISFFLFYFWLLLLLLVLLYFVFGFAFRAFPSGAVPTPTSRYYLATCVFEYKSDGGRTRGMKAKDKRCFCFYYSWAILHTLGGNKDVVLFHLFFVLFIYPRLLRSGLPVNKKLRKKKKEKEPFVNYIDYAYSRVVHYLWTPFRYWEEYKAYRLRVCVWRYGCTTCAKAIAGFQLLATCYV